MIDAKKISDSVIDWSSPFELRVDATVHEAIRQIVTAVNIELQLLRDELKCSNCSEIHHTVCDGSYDD